MKTHIVLVILLMIFATPAAALSIRDFNAKPPAEQAAYLSSFVEKMSADLGRVRPDLTTRIRAYFSEKPPGQPISEGIERLYLELTAIEARAQDGKADLSKIEIESVIVWIVKQKFPPEGH